jgi:hypothetical protein
MGCKARWHWELYTDEWQESRCAELEEEAGEKLGIPSLECTRKNSSSWGLSLPESWSD